MMTTVLPSRLGPYQVEALRRLSAPSTVYHVHPENSDKIPCFLSGYRVMFLAGSEDRGVVIIAGSGSDMRVQRTDGASGVASRRPCFVPINGMHRAVGIDARGDAAPYLVRVPILAVVDEYGVVRSSSGPRDGFPGAGQEAYLFPHGIHHRTSEYQISPDVSVGVTISGLYGGRSAQLTPIVGSRSEVTGIPVLALDCQEPLLRVWE